MRRLPAFRTDDSRRPGGSAGNSRPRAPEPGPVGADGLPDGTQSVLAPPSYHLRSASRSASVIAVALFSGMVFSATACW